MASRAVPTVFSRRLDSAIADSGQTARAIANEAGLSEASLSDYRKGRSTPDPDTIRKLCHLLQVKSDWLLGISDDQNQVPAGGADPVFYRRRLIWDMVASFSEAMEHVELAEDQQRAITKATLDLAEEYLLRAR